MLLSPFYSLQEAVMSEGSFNVLPGYGATTGKALVSHPLVRKVVVMGGTVAGKSIDSIVGGNLERYTAEDQWHESRHRMIVV